MGLLLGDFSPVFMAENRKLVELVTNEKLLASLAIAEGSFFAELATAEVHLRDVLVETEFDWLEFGANVTSVTERLFQRHAARAPEVVFRCKHWLVDDVGPNFRVSGERLFIHIQPSLLICAVVFLDAHTLMVQQCWVQVSLNLSIECLSILPLLFEVRIQVVCLCPLELSDLLLHLNFGLFKLVL